MLNQPDIQNPVIRTIARPDNANSRGDMFGGWLMGQMDIAGAVPAYLIANGEVATRAVNSIQFFKPVMLGMMVEFFVDVIHVGNSSITVQIKVYTRSRDDASLKSRLTAEAEFVYVAIKTIGNSRKL